MSIHPLVRQGLVAAIVAATAIAPASDARALSLFDLLFGTAPRPAAAPAMPAPAVRPSALTLTVTPPGLEQTFSGGSGGGGKTYCVRTCDGRYFPVATQGGNAAELCRALCPAAETKVFSTGAGGDMSRAVARDGTRYTRLPNAFAYRNGTSESCSCQHGGGAGLEKIDVMADPTLRVGDIVMTDEGPKVFRGAKRKTYGEANFTDGELPLSPATSARVARVRTSDAGSLAGASVSR